MYLPVPHIPTSYLDDDLSGSVGWIQGNSTCTSRRTEIRFRNTIYINISQRVIIGPAACCHEDEVTGPFPTGLQSPSHYQKKIPTTDCKPSPLQFTWCQHPCNSGLNIKTQTSSIGVCALNYSWETTAHQRGLQLTNSQFSLGLHTRIIKKHSNIQTYGKLSWGHPNTRTK
jgi:hypothetical protein